MNNKPFWKSKTIIVGILLALVGYLQGPEFVDAVGPDAARWIAPILGGIMVVLRGITNTGVTVRPQ